VTFEDLGYLHWQSPLLAADDEFDEVTSAHLVDNAVKLELASGQRIATAFSSPLEGVLRMRAMPKLAPGRQSPLLVALEDQPATITAAGNRIEVTGNSITATISTDGRITVGQFRTARFAASTRAAIRTGLVRRPDGTRAWLVPVMLSPDEQLYGGGESCQGPCLRGRLRRLVNCETHGAAGFDVSYLNVPFFWSDRGWGLFCHTSAPMYADLGATQADTAAFAIDGHELDVFIIEGSPTEILRRYLTLTGMPGKMPGWALGVWMSRCSYFSAAEIEHVLDELEAAECPVDVVHVDAWMTGNVIDQLTCNWSVDHDRFPTGWARSIHARGVRVCLWHNPYVAAGSERAGELESMGLLALAPDGRPAVTPDKPDRHIVDFTNPAALSWWQDRIRETMSSEENDAFKADFGEEIPEDAIFFDGRRGRDLRNEYALIYQAATHTACADQGVAALFCRSGTAGAQRFPCHWVGDTPATWSGLTDALRSSLSLSLSGFAFVGHDTGGFWVKESLERMKDAFVRMNGAPMRADVDAELYVRWSQFGALSPNFRYHGTSRREPTAYAEPARTHAIEACRLRSRLRPYLEQLAREAVTTGMPLMQPMPLAYPRVRAARDVLQYLLGPKILVAPILEPGGRRLVWAPPGRWTPLLAPEPIEGPGFVEVQCSLAEFPAWMRQG
jgi:alpha-D-xyloside xylohydrolase